jgi:hypothetical protein
MGPVSVWGDFVLDFLEVAALGGVLWQPSAARFRDSASGDQAN